VKTVRVSDKLSDQLTVLVGRITAEKLAKLKGLGIVSSRKEGKSAYYKIVNKKVKEMLKIVK